MDCPQNAGAQHDLSGPSWGSSQREGLPNSKDVEINGRKPTGQEIVWSNRRTNQCNTTVKAAGRPHLQVRARLEVADHRVGRGAQVAQVPAPVRQPGAGVRRRVRRQADGVLCDARGAGVGPRRRRQAARQHLLCQHTAEAANTENGGNLGTCMRCKVRFCARGISGRRVNISLVSTLSRSDTC